MNQENKLLRLFFALCLCLLAIQTAFASAEQSSFRFRLLGIDDGLPSGTINHISQQKNGYIWLASPTGATRFDGRSFKTLANTFDDGDVLSNNFVTRIEEDHQGNLWIATEGGLDKLAPDSSKPVHYRHISNQQSSLSSDWIVSMLVDSKGRVWLATGSGVNLYQPDTDDFTQITTNDPGININAVTRTIAEDGTGRIWVGYRSQLAFIHPQSGEIEPFDLSEKTGQKLDSLSILSSYTDSVGRVWFGTARHGVFSIHPSTFEVTFYNQQRLDIRGTESSEVTAMVEDNSGRFWVSLHNEGIRIIDPRHNTITKLMFDLNDTNSIPSDNILYLFKDQSGLIWIGTYEGVGLHDPRQQKMHIYRHLQDSNSISNDSVWSIQSLDGNMWLGTEDGLNKLDIKTKKVTRYLFSSGDPLLGDEVWKIAARSDGKLWLARNDGVSLFNPATGRVKNFDSSGEYASNIAEGAVYGLWVDANDNLWLATRNVGLSQFDPVKGTIKKYLFADSDEFVFDGNMPSELFQDSRGVFWLAATNGLYEINPKTDDVTLHKLGNGASTVRINDVGEDRLGNILVATQGAGFARLKPNLESPDLAEVVYFTQMNGLPENYVKSIETDNEGNVWMTTVSNLVKYDPVRQYFTQYPSFVNGNHRQFLEAAAAKDNEGRIYFGSSRGFVQFLPQDMASSEYVAPVLLTSVHVGDRKLLSATGTNFDESNYLDVDEKVIQFTFASLDFAVPEILRYRYKLQGFDDDWVFANRRRQAIYTNLPAGNYVFKVQGTNSDGVWSESEARYHFSVKESFWVSTWAYAFYISVFTCLVALASYLFVRRRKIKELNFLANYDTLTGLDNRYSFTRHLQKAISSATADQKVALLFLDLDNFKLVNDSLGHAVGDDLLIDAAKLIRQNIKREDFLARLGGDEFAIVIENVQEIENFEGILSRISNNVVTNFSLDDKTIRVTASIGVAIYPDDGKDGEMLLQNADTAMYWAKSKGRNNFQIFRPEMNDAVVERLDIESKIRIAIRDDQFELYYQPKINVTTGKVECVEGLLRWEHPEEGFILPNRFISVAEQSNLIVLIGDWVILEACKQARKWLDSGYEFSNVAINISPGQIYQSDLVESVKNALHHTGLPAKHLQLEITESLLMNDVDVATAVLTELKAVGVGLALDDFGTGYSSLSYLTKFPFDTIKIDRRFVQNFDRDEESQVVLNTIIELSRGLNKQAVAEGVEEWSQLRWLQQHNCHLVQGFLFSPAIKAQEMDDMFREKFVFSVCENGVPPILRTIS